MPELPLLHVEAGVELRCDHVLDADQARVFGRGVVDQALTKVVGDVGAVVLSFDAAGGIGGVNVVGVEVGTDILEWGEVLT